MDVSVENLIVKYKNFTAVKNISFEVKGGQILAIIGPNGSGKTSTIECIEGLRKPASGTIQVLGMDPQKQRKEIYKKVGIQLQEAQYQSKIKVHELCDQFSSFYDSPADYKSLLKQFDLEKKSQKYVSTLSGGEKQKLSILLALIPKPRILFLDELTTGLDPEARHDLWNYMKEINAQGITILMISHFMDEVEYLADEVILLKDGDILETGTVEALRKKSGLSKKAAFYVSDMDNVNLDFLKSIKGVLKVYNHNNQIIIYGNGLAMGDEISQYLKMSNCTYTNFVFSEITFEDIYLIDTDYNFNSVGGGAEV